MRDDMSKLGRWFLGVACLLLVGCASTGAPDKWLSKAKDAPQDPYGAWVTVDYVKTYRQQTLAGEFLAVDRDSLYILVDSRAPGDLVVGIDLAKVKKAKVAHFDPNTNKAIEWVMLGSISTVSNGWGLVITFPLWTIVGSAMAGVQSHTALENYSHLTWEELSMYARFPQGPPPRLHGLKLRPKMVINHSPPPPVTSYGLPE